MITVISTFLAIFLLSLPLTIKYYLCKSPSDELIDASLPTFFSVSAFFTIIALSAFAITTIAIHTILEPYF